MLKLLDLFLKSKSIFVDRYKDLDSQSITNKRSCEFFVDEKRQCLVDWVNSELKGSCFHLSTFKGAHFFICYKETESEHNWAEFGDKALQLIEAVKHHDIEVQKAFMEDMQ